MCLTFLSSRPFSNVDKALELSTIVADKRHKIYLEFLDNGLESGVQENRMPTYLSMVRDANLLRLKQQGHQEHS